MTMYDFPLQSNCCREKKETLKPAFDTMVARVPGCDTLLKDLCRLGRHLCQSEGGDDGELPRRVIELLVASLFPFLNI
jgi:hypothetical protein